MSLDVSAELATPGVIAWTISADFAIGAFRPPLGSVPATKEMVETHHCFGLCDAPGEVEVEGEGRGSVGPDIVRFHSTGDRLLARTLPDARITAAWVVLSDETVEGVLSEFGGRRMPTSRPFPRSLVAATLPDLAALRVFFRRVEKGASLLWAEEAALALLGRLLQNARSLQFAGVSQRQRALARDADYWITGNFAEPISLGGVARMLGVSPAHLARSYRAVTGRSMHARLTSLRLSAAMSRLAEAAPDLTGLALDFGFASHSHFTEAFRRKVGVPPSAFRALCAG